uniref:Uncharacterized protein n=1 Tax=Labrus bergylta TaxID=56723 RepID=A0A3Q3ETI1_9LABR
NLMSPTINTSITSHQLLSSRLDTSYLFLRRSINHCSFRITYRVPVDLSREQHISAKSSYPCAANNQSDGMDSVMSSLPGCFQCNRDSLLQKVSQYAYLCL